MNVARRGAELVPLDERLRYLRLLRAVMAGATVVAAALLPEDVRRHYPLITGSAVGYLTVCLVAEASWRSRRPRVGWLAGALLVLDGGYLAWVSYLTGAASSPLRYLILVHLGAVTLLASHRTVVAMAAWDSVLQVGTHYAAVGSVLHGTAASLTAARPWTPIVGFLAAIWAVALTISTLASVNERELRRRRFELEMLARMARSLEDAHEPLAVGDDLLSALHDTFGFRRMALFEVVDDLPRLLTCRNIVDARVADFRIGRESILVKARGLRRTVLARALDPVADPWLAAIMPGAGPVMAVPLVAGTVTGILVVETGKARTAVERRVVATTERFVAHAALALRNADLLERVQEMAVTDGLTGLANRRSFDRALDRELQRAVRTNGRLSVVLVDIDHFKALNDGHGHLVGDTVLRQVAAALRECGREYDTIARYGGEEFAAVLPGCSPGLALQVAERLRRAVEEAQTDVAVTASAGVATFPYDGTDPAGLLQAADEALYAAKHAGRNQVRCAEQTRAGRDTAAG